SLDLEIHEDVFWDEENNETGRWVTENLPPMEGKVVLEIGCGCGLTALYMAKSGAKHVLATDITGNSVENTRINIKRNNVKNIEVLQSNMFDNIDKSQRFDRIVFHLPSTKVPVDFAFTRAIEHSSFDPGGSILNSFLTLAPHYLLPYGALLLGYNVSRDDTCIQNEVAKFPLSAEKVASKKFTTDGMINIHLYEIRPREHG
ncbi:methyltransferase domain-containing protein, partial [Mesorhizobium sp. M4A.F.Ca.ET.050.02.1.1]|uniref:methyltransferase n=1 Tax=Mesorhizobium sp. M4A.F.Ca.ET.050.02.1.1 TaxID=2496754 RepID=UPI000FCAA47D